jgi:hypothetical protein
MSTPIAANISALYAKTESVTAGVYDAPANTDAIRVIGEPKFSIRKGIIRRTNSFTPQGGDIKAVTGSKAWKVEFQTETYLADAATSFDTNPLARLFRACPFVIADVGATFVLSASAQFGISVGRSNAFDCQPLSLAFEQRDGKRFECSGAVGLPTKITGKSGDRVLIDWSFSGLWRDVSDSTGLVPTYTGQDAPLIAAGQVLVTEFSGTDPVVTNVSDWEYTTGWSMSDVEDLTAEFGFGMGFLALKESPMLKLTCASTTEAATATWADAMGNVQGVGSRTTLRAGRSPRFLDIKLRNAELAAVPEDAVVSEYRAQKLTLMGVCDTSNATAQSQIIFT